jgi:thioredoxin-dependent adenylylsulfate APS reductase
MVKKRLLSGEPCRKCIQTEEMLRQRGLWDRIDEVVWAQEGDPQSPGMQLAERFGVDTAPFFLVADDGGQVSAIRSALQLIREHLQPARPEGDGRARELDAAAAAAELATAAPEQIVRWGQERFGADLVIAFGGSDDVALIDMAAKSGLPFSVVTIDTGRLHPETYEFVDRVRRHYGIEIQVTSPDAVPIEALVRRKGLFSFYQDGHTECCAIRKVDPLRRVLSGFRAWATGQRRDQNAATRGALPTVELDPVFTGVTGALVKLNPLAGWSRDDLWAYLRAHQVPSNALHARGFASIGCAPCTRAIAPGQSEREGRWWWEDAGKKECGLHAGNLTARSSG